MTLSPRTRVSLAFVSAVTLMTSRAFAQQAPEVEAPVVIDVPQESPAPPAAPAAPVVAPTTTTSQTFDTANGLRVHVVVYGPNGAPLTAAPAPVPAPMIVQQPVVAPQPVIVQTPVYVQQPATPVYVQQPPQRVWMPAHWVALNGRYVWVRAGWSFATAPAPAPAPTYVAPPAPIAAPVYAPAPAVAPVVYYSRPRWHRRHVMFIRGI